MKIAYCGYDFFSACLRKLLAAHYNVYRVFTVSCDNRYNFNRYIYEIAQAHGLPVSEERVDEQIIRQLQQEGCELLVTAAYYYKIPDLSTTGIKGINIHPTLLPTGRGVWPLPWTILTSQQQTGISIHKLTQDYDAGDILLQKSFPLARDECLESLSAKLQLLAKDLLMDTVNNFDDCWRNAEPQTGPVTHWENPTRAQRTLHWHDSVENLGRICRAFGKFGCFARFNDKDWVVYDLSGWVQTHRYSPGSVVHRTNTEMIVAAADGLVSVRYFEPEVHDRDKNKS